MDCFYGWGYFLGWSKSVKSTGYQIDAVWNAEVIDKISKD
jgi:hypothetical protein